jgi:hypothetical protein
MEQLPDSNLIYLMSGDGIEKSVVINLSQVRMVSEMDGGSCKIWFSENHVVNLNGPAASQFTTLLLKRTILPSGDAFKPHLEKAFKDQAST